MSAAHRAASERVAATAAAGPLAPDSNKSAWTRAFSAAHAPYMQRLVAAAGCGLPAAIPFTSENVFDVSAISRCNAAQPSTRRQPADCMEIIDVGKLNSNSWR